MLIQSEKQKKIMNIVEDLPPEQVDKIIDFAEHLKEEKETSVNKKEHAIIIPTFHLGRIEREATERDKLYREYLDSKSD